MTTYNLTHLRQLEAESIHIIREVAAEFENPVMLYSIGKDSPRRPSGRPSTSRRMFGRSIANMPRPFSRAPATCRTAA
jgi:hypothetical protein